MKKKSKYKSIGIRKAEYIAKNKVKTASKFKRFVANIFGIHIAEKYRYSFRITYTGQKRLKVNDVVATEQGVVFLVLDELNRMAVIVSKEPYQVIPVVNGRVYILTR